MKNYTLWVLAVLCLSFTSCLEEESQSDAFSYETELESRSGNNIHLSYTSADGTVTTDCTLVEVDYNNSSWATLIISYSDGSTATVSGNNIQFTTSTGIELDVLKDGTVSFTAYALDVIACGQVLCYDVPGVEQSGTGADFIIEDTPSGM